MGRTYAALNSTKALDTDTTTTPDFLDSLWRAQLPTDPSTPKPYQEIRAELQRGMTALDTLLDGVEDPLGALRFVHNLVQAATNVESLSDEGTLDAQFLRELVAFGFEYAKLNPASLPNTGEETDAFLATLWQEASDYTPSMRKAIGTISDLFEAQDSPEKRIKLLQFATSLLKTAKLVPALQAQIHDPKLLSAIVEMGGAYAALNPTNAPSSNNEFFLSTLFATNNFDRAAQQFQEFLSAANSLTPYGNPSIFRASSDGRIFYDAPGNDADYYYTDGEAAFYTVYSPIRGALDEQFASLKIVRADGREEIYTGDQRFRVYLNPASLEQLNNLRTNEVALFAGDHLYVENFTIPVLDQIRGATKLMKSLELVGRTTTGEVLETWNLIKDNWLLATGVLGTFAALQFTPAGPVLDAILLLAAGYQAGYSIASFVIEAGWAETQQDLYEGAQHFSQFLSALLEIGTSSALLRYSRGGQEPVSIADDLSRVWETLGRLTNKFNAIRQPELTTAQRLDSGISALFDAFNAPDSAIGQLLSYGDRQVVEYLKEAVGALTENLTELGTLRQRLLPLMQELGERWNRVNQVAEQLAQNAGLATALSQQPNLVTPLLQFRDVLGPELFSHLLNPQRSVQTIVDSLRAIDSADNDIVAINAIAEVVRLNRETGGVSNVQMENTFSSLADFMESYPGRLSGDFATRFLRTFQSSTPLEQIKALQARSEINLAEDFLEGRTLLGNSRMVEGVVQPRTEEGNLIQGVPIPEYRVVSENGVKYLAEVKTPDGDFTSNNVKRNLSDAMSQIREEALNTDIKGYIRIDYITSNAPSTALAPDEIFRAVNGELRAPRRVDIGKETREIRGVDFVEFVEILYQE
ncbi:hypothetical protein HJG54_17760 [Leptolyngbya sp. NK1-12]|uniref:Uncharacterized protein n=1 Tax=Leptolyngbya sp. NK1-12 TaxID=2547451 RepID=A0AA96WE25_9CYAN|nr:hypothetical protein [Leptolyngbya sp. NK1-12]WNZ24517.1 hypothetical protein HJG54_17760 [Leptolyngbya sp. NK1-12]